MHSAQSSRMIVQITTQVDKKYLKDQENTFLISMKYFWKIKIILLKDQDITFERPRKYLWKIKKMPLKENTFEN